MSTYYDVRCVECDTHMDLNHPHGGHKYIQEAYKARKEISDVQNAIALVNKKIHLFFIWEDADMDMGLMVRFIGEHWQHTLQLWDEYGYQYDWETLERKEEPMRTP